MNTRAPKRGLFVFCPNAARHRVLQAWLGSSPEARGGVPSLRLFLRQYREGVHTPTESGSFVECARDGADHDTIIVSCPCNRGTSWALSPRHIAKRVPDSGKLDLTVDDLA